MKNLHLLACLFLIGSTGFLGCTGFPLPDKEDDGTFTITPPTQSITTEDIKEQGKRACENGIPADANPYVNKHKGAVEWLDGYQEKLEENKMKEVK